MSSLHVSRREDHTICDDYIIRGHYQSVCEELHTNRTEMLISTDVRFGSKADICNAKRHVRFTPNSDRKSAFPHKVMSALPLKADIRRASAR
jgi:hypothetical protein